MNRISWVLAGSLLLAVRAAAASALPDSPPPLAVVNGEKVTGAEIQADFTRRHGGHQKFLLGKSEVRSFLDIYIDDRLLVQEAYRLDIQNEESVKAAAAEYAIRKSVEAFLRDEIERKAAVTEEDVRAAWQNETTRLYLMRQIVVDTRAEADSIAFALASGANFNVLARECSTAPSRLQGGEVDWLGWGVMEAGWEKEVFSLYPGETSLPFRTRDGWEIVQLGAISVVDPPELAGAKSRIQGILHKRRVDARREALTELLWSKYRVAVSAVDLTPESLHAAVISDADGPLARWDGGELTVKQFVSRVDWGELAGLTPGRIHTEIEERLHDAVNERLVRLEAMARKYDQTPDVAGAVRWYTEDRMLGVLYKDYVLKGVTVSEDEARQYLAEHRSQLSSPEKRRVSHIVAASAEEAREIRSEIEAGKPFAEVAKARSTDTATAKKGGDLGWIGSKEAPGEFQAVFALEQGAVSEPIESRFGWHLFVVTAIQAPEPLAFEEAKAEIDKRLMEKKQREQRAVWVKKLREHATISVNKAGIDEFVRLNTPKS
jgi:parvulin-like peptidyl-prolyl isomerase